MEERIKEIYDDIRSNLHNGYDIDELQPVDRADLDGFVWGILMAENGCDNYIADLDNSTIDKLKKEIAAELWEELCAHMIHNACDLVYSHMDGYEEADE